MPELLLNIALLIAVLILLGVYVSWRATRLDRLHVRLETARAGLDVALVRRGAGAPGLAPPRPPHPAAGPLPPPAPPPARLAPPPQPGVAPSDPSPPPRAGGGPPP